MSKVEKPGTVGQPTSPTPTSPAGSEKGSRGAMAEGTLGDESKDIEERIRAALCDETLGNESLAAAIGASLDEVLQATRKLAENQKIVDVGSDDQFPRWTWRISKLSPAELRQQILRLLGERPSSIGMLTHATGAPRERVDATLSGLVRDASYEDRIEKLGDDDDAVWYLHPVQRQRTGFGD